MKVIAFPLARIAVVFILGIVISSYYLISFWLVLTGVLVLFFTQIMLFLKSKNPIYFGINMLILSFMVGVLTVQIHNQSTSNNHYLKSLKTDQNTFNFELQVTKKLKNSATNYRYEAELIRLNDSLKTGRLILNLNADNFKKSVEIGTHIQGFGSFYANREPTNPGQFNYADYLKRKQIYGQIFASPENLKVGNKLNKSLSYYAEKIRNKVIINLRKNHFREAELNIVMALILGQQQDISPEILKDYQSAGAIHVLSVSGLHVGFILLFITLLLKPFLNSEKGKLIKLLLTILTLWLFGILAGLAPCVIRSAAMFSIVAIGNYMNRGSNIYHTLLVSLLLILLVEPSFLFDVGFQLSYSALFFIVWFQPYLAYWYVPKNKIATYFWEVFTVSIAAQLGAFPLSIYYFHQFPGLFFVTNLLILFPLTLILGLGVLVVLLASVDLVWAPLLKLLEYSIWSINQIVKLIGSIESFVLKIKSLLSANQIDSAIAECDKQKGSVANVIRATLLTYKDMVTETGFDKEQKVAAIQKSTEEATSLELPMLEKNLTILSTLASVATLVALLGTVIGMIKAFAGMATAGAPDATALANGISEALINTAIGIGTSAVSIICYNYFTSKIDTLSYSIDEAGMSIAQTFATNQK